MPGRKTKFIRSMREKHIVIGPPRRPSASDKGFGNSNKDNIKDLKHQHIHPKDGIEPEVQKGHTTN